MADTDRLSTVRRLPPSIAARVRGEVTIPTFARAVEEVMLNSLDAGASEIVATIDMPGRSFSVRDNGHGMDRAALCRVGEGQSTSKLQTVEQLSAGIRTFGFRGEALTALAAVALVEIVSRPRAPAGAPTLSTILRLGHRESFGAASEARAPGTTVSVRDLFCNRAVARKQLQLASSARAEASTLLARLTRLAVAHPNVAFRLYDAARAATLLSKARSASSLAAFRQLLGDDHTLSMFDVRLDAAGYSIRGHLTSPPGGSRSREMQLLCVNNRPLSRRSELHKLVEAAYTKVQAATDGGGATPGARPVSTAPLHPAFLLFIHCSPSCYDVSLDVDKCDVLFVDSLAVRRAVVAALTRFFSAGASEAEAQAIRTSLGMLATGKREPGPALPAHGGPARHVETSMDSAVGSLSGECAGRADAGAAPPDVRGVLGSQEHVEGQESPNGEGQEPPSCGWPPSGAGVLSSQEHAQSHEPAGCGWPSLAGGMHSLHESHQSAPSHGSSDGGALVQQCASGQRTMMTSSLLSPAGECIPRQAGPQPTLSTLPRTAVPLAASPSGPSTPGCSIGGGSPALPENWLASPCGPDPASSPGTGAVASAPSNSEGELRLFHMQVAFHKQVAVRSLFSFSVTTDAAGNATPHAATAEVGSPAGAPVDDAVQRIEQAAPNEARAHATTVAQATGVRGLLGLDPPSGVEALGLDSIDTAFLEGGDASVVASTLASAAYDDASVDTWRPSKRPRRSARMQPVASAPSLPSLGAVPTLPTTDLSAGGIMGSAARSPSSETVSKAELLGLRAIGQIERRFIAARVVGPGGEGTRLILVDPHAADERVQLERLQAATVSPTGLPVPGAIVRRALRPPASLHVAPHERLMLDRFSARLAAWGWMVELVGGVEEHVALHSVPTVHGVGLSWAGAVEYLQVLEESGGGSTQPPPAVTRLLASKACRSAVMFGDILSPAESQAVLRALAQCNLPFQCAHGRPTIAPMLWLR